MHCRFQDSRPATSPITLAVAALVVSGILGSSAAVLAQQTNSASAGTDVSAQPYYATAWLRIELDPPYVAYPQDTAVPFDVYRRSQARLMLSPVVLRAASQSPELSEKFAAANIDDGVWWLRRRLAVGLLGKSELMMVTVRDADQDLASTAANAIVSSYFKAQAQSEADRTQALLEQLEEERERFVTANTRLQGRLRELDAADEETRSTHARLQEELTQADEIRNRIDDRLYQLRVEARSPARITPLKDASPESGSEPDPESELASDPESKLDPDSKTPDAEDLLLADVEADSKAKGNETVWLWAEPIAPTNVLRKLVEHDKRPWYAAEAWVHMKFRQPYLVFPRDGEATLEEFAATQAALIRSTLVLERIAAEPKIGARLAAFVSRTPMKWISRRIVVERLGESEYIRIAAITTDAQLSADLTNAIVQAYLGLQTQNESYRNRRVLDVLEEDGSRRQAKIQADRDTLAEMEKLFEDHEQRPDVLLRRKELARLETTNRIITDRVLQMRFETRAPARATLAFPAELPQKPFKLLPNRDEVSASLPQGQSATLNSAADNDAPATDAAQLGIAPVVQLQRGQPIHLLLAAGFGFVVAIAAVMMLRRG